MLIKESKLRKIIRQELKSILEQAGRIHHPVGEPPEETEQIVAMPSEKPRAPVLPVDPEGDRARRRARVARAKKKPGHTPGKGAELAKKIAPEPPKGLMSRTEFWHMTKKALRKLGKKPTMKGLVSLPRNHSLRKSFRNYYRNKSVENMKAFLATTDEIFKGLPTTRGPKCKSEAF